MKLQNRCQTQDSEGQVLVRPPDLGQFRSCDVFEGVRCGRANQTDLHAVRLREWLAEGPSRPTHYHFAIRAKTCAKRLRWLSYLILLVMPYSRISSTLPLKVWIRAFRNTASSSLRCSVVSWRSGTLMGSLTSTSILGFSAFISRTGNPLHSWGFALNVNGGEAKSKQILLKTTHN